MPSGNLGNLEIGAIYRIFAIEKRWALTKRSMNLKKVYEPPNILEIQLLGVVVSNIFYVHPYLGKVSFSQVISLCKLFLFVASSCCFMCFVSANCLFAVFTASSPFVLHFVISPNVGTSLWMILALPMS